jgi:hypothetical protein
MGRKRRIDAGRQCRRIVWTGEGDEERLVVCWGTLRRAYVRVGDDSPWRSHAEVWGTVCERCGLAEPA